MDRSPRGKWRALALSVLTSSALGFGGCALVLGIEKRTEAEEQPGVLDEETDIRTTELCVEYCNLVGENCTEELAVYASRSSCINTCNALPPGLDSEPFDNTVECRMQRAISAAGDPDEFCMSAGPGPAGSCGSNCDAWCHLLEHQCPEEYSVLQDCMASCETIPDAGVYNVQASYQADDIQCRLIHLGAVADDPIHCSHGNFAPTDQCIPGEDGTPDCPRYCGLVTANCTGEFAVYENQDDCLAACAAMPLGNVADRSENTVGCRTYHGGAAAMDPILHCDHAGPSGDGTCGAEPASGQTGNCDSYCFLLEAGCPDEFSAEFADTDECSQACATDFDGNGANLGSLYTVETARDEDSLQCRVYYAVLATGGDVAACDLAVPDSTCQ